MEALENNEVIHVGVGTAARGAFYEEANGTPNGSDGVISPILPVNQMTHTFTQNYRTEAIKPYEAVSCPISHTCPKGTEALFGQEDEDVFNLPTHFEGGRPEVLEDWDLAGGVNSTAWSPASEEITNVNTVEGEVEIKG